MMEKEIKIQIFDYNREVVDQMQEILEKEGWKLEYREEHTETYEYGLSRTLKVCEDNPADSETANCTMFDVSGSLPEPTMQELEDMIDYINTQVAADQLDDFMDKAGKLNNFVKKYQGQ